MAKKRSRKQRRTIKGETRGAKGRKKVKRIENRKQKRAGIEGNKAGVGTKITGRNQKEKDIIEKFFYLFRL